RLDSIAVVPEVKVPEDAVPRAWRQHRDVLDRSPVIDQAVPQREEERLVFHDRPADAHRVLMTITPVQRYGLPAACQGIALAIIAPGIGVQRAVAEGPYRGASQLISS